MAKKRGRPAMFVGGLVPINLYLSVEDAEKLGVLSEILGRSKSDVMRLLIRSAKPTGLPEVETEPIEAKRVAA